MDTPMVNEVRRRIELLKKDSDLYLTQKEAYQARYYQTQREIGFLEGLLKQSQTATANH